jgi:hypothetical protein
MDESIGHGNVLGQLAVERNREVAPMNGVACMVLIHSRIFSVMDGVLTDDFLKRSVKVAWAIISYFECGFCHGVIFESDSFYSFINRAFHDKPPDGLAMIFLIR